MENKISFKMKLVISFFMFYLLPLVVVTSIGFNVMTKQLKKHEEETYRKNFDIAVDQLDQLFRSMQEYNLNMQNRSWLKSMIYMENIEDSTYDRVDFQNFVDEIAGFTYQNDYIEQIFYYFGLSEQLLSTTDVGIVNYDWFTNMSFQNDFMLQDSWQERIKKLEKPEYEYVTVNNYGRIKKGILCSYPVRAYKGENICTICFFVLEEKLKNFLDKILPDEENWFYVEYDNHVLINKFPYSEKELNHLSDSSINKENMIKLSRESEYSGFTYYNLIPKSSLYTKVRQIQMIFLIVLIGFVAVGFFLSYYIAIRNYRPVQNLMALLNSEETSEEVRKNEFYWLQKSIREIMDKGKNLDIQIEEQKPILKNAFLTWILKDNQKPEENQILKTAGSLELDIGYSTYNLLLCSLKAGNALNKEIHNKLNEYGMHFENFVYQNDYIVILNYEKEEDASLFYAGMSEMLEQRKERYFFGVGEPCKSIAKLSETYMQAKQARNFRMINRKCGITFFHEVMKEKCYYYPIEKEYTLRNCLLAGEYENSAIIFDELLEENVKDQQVSFERIQNLFSNVELTCLKTLERLEVKGILDMELEKFKDEGTLEEYTSTIHEMFYKICKYVNAHREDNSEVMKETLCRFVEENLCDNNLSLNYVAEEFSLSSSYVSRLFKEKTGNNFLDYMNRRRIEKAKIMLLSEKGVSIQQIGILVGYDSDATFRRIFKKYEGVTPSQFRKIQ